VTGQENTITANEFLREGCSVLLRWIESWSEPHCSAAPLPVAGHIRGAFQDKSSALPLEHEALPNDPGSSSLVPKIV
jgi:hypothetical protein